jgi:hypothetical protein
VVTHLIKHASGKMFELVKNESKYWDFIKNLRCDDRIQENFVEQVKITSEQQQAYMKKHNDDFFICLTYLNGIDYQIPVGFIGVVDYDIRIAVIPELHGQGAGKFMLNKIKELYPLAIAKVKLANTASKFLFASCGYDKFMKDEKFEYYRYREVNYRFNISDSSRDIFI